MSNSKTLIIYSSRRGSTKQYAEWIAEDLGKSCDCDLFTYSDSKKINLYEYDLIVYGGWIRGSGIVDFDNFRKRLDGELLDNLIVFGVGIANQSADNYSQVWTINIGKVDKKNEHKVLMYILDGRYDPEQVTGFDGFLMKIIQKVLKSGSTKDAATEADMMENRLINGCDLVKRENINSLVRDCKKKLEK